MIIWKITYKAATPDPITTVCGTGNTAVRVNFYIAWYQ